jgi:hypothetical protein
MLDIAFIVGGLAMFIVAIAYTYACEKL